MQIRTHNHDGDLVQNTRSWDRQHNVEIGFDALMRMFGGAWENNEYQPVWYVRVGQFGDCLIAPNIDYYDSNDDWDDILYWTIYSERTTPASHLLLHITRTLINAKRPVVIGKSTKLPLPDARRTA